jgi:DNA replication regulator DPB11
VASSKLGDQNEGIWGDIVGGGFDLTESTDSIRLKTGTASLAKARPVIQQVKSFASETTINDRRDSIILLDEELSSEPGGFLQDCYFYIHGFSSKQVSVTRRKREFC